MARLRDDVNEIALKIFFSAKRPRARFYPPFHRDRNKSRIRENSEFANSNAGRLRPGTLVTSAPRRPEFMQDENIASRTRRFCYAIVFDKFLDYLHHHKSRAYARSLYESRRMIPSCD